MLYHFSDLTDDISPLEREKLKPMDKQSYNSLHNIVPNKFKIPSNLGTLDNSNLNKNTFLESFTKFLEINNMMSFSFVRHPFER